MNFDEYQQKSKVTDTGTTIGTHFGYLTMGLIGEAGELANKIKKVFRDDDGKVTDSRKEEVEQELGDVLWYMSQLATDFELSLDDVAQANLDKLLSRKDRGTISGSGDVR